MASPSGIDPSAASALVVESCKTLPPKVWNEREEGKEEVINLAEMLTGTERFRTCMGIDASVAILLGST